MRWLRAHVARLAAPPDLDPPAVDGLTCEHRMVLLRRGDHDCHVQDHHDALRALGHTIAERDAWRARALTAEAKLRHPANGDLAA